MIYTASNTKKYKICYKEHYIRGGKPVNIYFVIPADQDPQEGKEAETLPLEYEIYETKQSHLPIVRRKR